MRILIIKLGAAGDVLRTTSLLGNIREAHPGAHVSWVCAPGSFPLIRCNPLIDRPLPLTLDTLVQLDVDHYDLCVNFDLSPEAVSLTERINADLYRGYGRRSDGSVFPFTPEGEEWLEMSLWDDLKKANRRTYQSHMRSLLHLSETEYPILVPLRPEAVQQAEAFARRHDLVGRRPVIGFNVGAGDRWQHKKWTVEGYAELAERLHETYRCPLLILYGPDDEPRAKEVMQALTVPFVDTGLHPSIFDFIAIMNLCDVVVTGDTLALHAALGLGKRVVCLVGPTSAGELELYGQGVVLQGEIDCLCCYRTRCDKDPHCMKRLDAGRVFDAVREQVERVLLPSRPRTE